jgi:hypothetical protein
VACYHSSGCRTTIRFMTLTSLESIISALNAHGVRYLIVGGVAVAAHGYGRRTFDLDLVIQLTESNVLQAIDALESLQYKPIVPVNPRDFADAAKRTEWIEQKNMLFFSLRSESHPVMPIDVFVSEPFAFDVEYNRALIEELGPNVPARFICLETLITMEEATGRSKDDEDVRQLKLLLENG